MGGHLAPETVVAPAGGSGQRFTDRSVVMVLLGGGGRQVLAALIGFVTFPLITRLLEADEFGAWSVIGQASFVIGLADLGLTLAVQRAAVSGDGQYARRMVGLALMVNAVLLPLLASIAFFAIGLLPEVAEGVKSQLGPASAVALCGGVVGGLCGPLRGFVFARGGASRIATARVLGSAAYLTGAAGAFVLRLGLLAPALGLLMGQGVELLMTARAARALDPGMALRPRWPGDRAEVRRAFFDGAAGATISVASTLQTGIDTFVLSAFVPLHVVGGYRIGLRAPELGYLLAKQVTSPLMPQLGSPEQRTRTARVGTGLFGGLIVSLMAPLALCAQPLLVLWLGDKAAGSVPATALMLMAFAAMVQSIYDVVGSMVMLGARTAWSGAIPVLVGTAANLAVSLGGVRRFGVWAVAGSTPIGYLVTATLVWMAARRLCGWSGAYVGMLLAPPFGAALASIGVSLALRGFAHGGVLPSLLSCVAGSLAGVVAASVLLRLASHGARAHERDCSAMPEPRVSHCPESAR